MSIFDDSRATWGARSPKSAAVKVAPSRRTEFFNHYDGGHPLGLGAKPHSACLAQVKADQAFHMNGNGWNDIGYNGLVCQHGRAIEGRGIDAIGAHCPNHNTTGYGFQFMVGGNESPTPAAFARMAKLYSACTARSGHALAKKGHRDGWATECPGDIVEDWVKSGMKTTTTTPNHQSQEDEVTPEDIDKVANAVVKKLLAADVIPAPTPNADNPTFGVASALEWTLRRATQGRAETLAVKAALAALAQSLPADVAAKVTDALGADYDAEITLTPKES